MSAKRISNDVVRIEDKFYVLASSALADDRTRVLKYGDTFAIFNRYGDIENVGNGEFGIFHAETRHLSRMTLQVDDQTPLLLSSTIRDDNAFLSIDLTNLDRAIGSENGLARGTVHFFRSKFLDEGICYEQLRLTNHGMGSAEVTLFFGFEADFADIFEVRGTRRERHGVHKPDRVQEDAITLSYLGLDNVLRRTSIRFSPQPDSLSAHAARYLVRLEPKEERVVSITVLCEREAARKEPLDYGQAFEQRLVQLQQPRFAECHIDTSSKCFNSWLARSAADLHMMIQGNPEGAYPYAGVPWFNTVFGRDGIITAMECLLVAPSIAEGVLNYLAKTQASDECPEQDAQPGKIVHEIRRGEMAALKEVPFGCYYGSVDSTPLFIMLAGSYLLRTGNLPFLKALWPNICRALEWIDHYGDSDGDGFVEYARQSAQGLTQQGWKDSSDAVFHSDGRLPKPPIALCEVQAYVYAARRAAALIAKSLGDEHYAGTLERQAADLQKHFEESFWSDEMQTYALALDGQKQQCRVRTSNAGHALFCKIASPERAAVVSRTLMSDSLFSGWGIRTLATNEIRYNPMSYHNGSIWPHDNAIIAHGLSHYGFQSSVSDLLTCLYEASSHVESSRMPELFCGFHKRHDSSGPTLYPVACSPQSWAAGSIFLLLQSALGITINAQERLIRFTNPVLPADLEAVTITDLRVADTSVDFLIRRHPEGVAVEVLGKCGSLEIVKSL